MESALKSESYTTMHGLERKLKSLSGSFTAWGEILSATFERRYESSRTSWNIFEPKVIVLALRTKRQKLLNIFLN
jgi:hypothetical protein